MTTATVPPHGTHGCYANCGCRCAPCIEAARVHVTGVRAERARRGLDPDDPRHGSPSTYQNWGCRCDACRAAASLSLIHI